ncbi:CBS domain-containing protein [Bacteriovoracaceae bacterium]|nr:CBS domain-containing protein [Bacteriovoracaceae bacterium]
MDAKIVDLMKTNAIFASAHQTIGHVKAIFSNNGLTMLPVVDKDEFVVGVISIKDILKEESDTKKVESVMITKVYTIPQYEKAQTAARMMRNHKIHHLIVTHEKKLKGIISSFDLLKLIENHRFIQKNMGTKPSKHQSTSLMS